MNHNRVGIVRLYNDSSGIGFITEIIRNIDSAGNNTTLYLDDYFVHCSTLKFKSIPAEPRLHVGEYVEFKIDVTHVPPQNNRQRVTSVSGLFGGTLMCEHASVRFVSYSYINKELFPPHHSPD